MCFKLYNSEPCTARVQLIRSACAEKFKHPIIWAGDVECLLGDELRKQDREHFLVIYLTSANKVIDIEEVAVGTLNETVVSPREIFKGAILANAASIILVHNHPSGSINPSKEDEDLTRHLARIGKMLNIPLRDHIIIGHTFRSIGNGEFPI
jgi:DNA repair protein RadC